MKHSKGHSFKRIFALVVVLFVVSIPFLPLTKAYFVGYDDFNNLHQAAFEDAQQPSRIFTTSHFNSAKYRPLDRGITFITYQIDHGNPFAFRARNLFFHLLNCAVLFCLGMVLFDSIFIAALGAALFGLNPLAHQAVAGAVWTNTAAASMELIAVVLGLWSYQSTKHQLRWLILAIIPVLIGVYIYEPVVAAPGIIFLYFGLDSLYSHRLRVRKSWVWTLLLLSTVVVASMVVARALVQPGPNQPVGHLAAIAKNSVMYVIALLLPIDPLLANHWFGTPLVSEVPLDGISQKVIAVAVVFGVCLVALLLFAFRRPIRRYVSSLSIMPCAFLLCAASFAILPLLVFNNHPSETYLYVPVAFAMLLLARVLSGLRSSHPIASIVVIAVLFTLFGCGTWGRSRRVIYSAAIAHRILTELPSSNWQQGDWHIRLANAPGYTLPHPYGLYTYRGLDTIGNGTSNGFHAVQHALQLQTGNEDGVVVDVLSAQQLSQTCSPATAMREPCFWVYPDGRVEQFLGATANPPLATR